MPRLSLFRPEKSNDYKFIDRQISEMFTIGATDVYLHKYLGPKNPTEANATADQPIYNTVSETNIQDLLFLEIRDRMYDSSIYRIRGHYQVQDIDFNLSQFGLFLDNDMVYMTVHINDFVNTIGRKPLSGDVLELPHLADQFALNSADISLPRFFVIEEVGRAAEGFSMTWWPHLYRLKLKKMTDSQQFDDILNKPTGADADNFAGEWTATGVYYTGQIVRYAGQLYTVVAGYNHPTGTSTTPPGAAWSLYNGSTLEAILGTANKNLEINDAILAQAEADAPKSGYETQHLYTLAIDETGKPALRTADETDIDASLTTLDASRIADRPTRAGYTGYLLGDGIPENGVEFGHGIAFPTSAVDGDYFLRTDFFPNRLFRFNGARWVKREDNVRHTLTNTDTRTTLRTGFINNTNTNTIDGEEVAERQSLAKALKPRADL